MQQEKSDIFELITKQIIQAVETGAGKFRMPWHVTEADYFAPVNAMSRRAYRGVNVLVLWVTTENRGYKSGLWATYQQWQQLGGQVRKGEKAAPVVFWKFSDRDGSSKADEAEQEPEGHSSSRGILAKGYSVFNADQVEGYTPPAKPLLPECERIATAEQFFAGLGADVRHGGAVACYQHEDDIIRMPAFASFKEVAGYYSVRAHETTHWTGAPKRLARDLRCRFGSGSYAMEELVAELGAAFLCSTLGISNTPRPDHAAYIVSWLEALKRDKCAIFTAASQAQKAVDWMSANSAVQSQAA